MRPLALLLLAACGGSKSPPPTPSGPPAALEATAAPDDVQVATVNGRPVWGSCVAAQATRGISREEALRQCVDFELLAQAAEERGIALDPEVRTQTRTALVSQLVAKDYEDKYQQPSDFGALWTALYNKNKIHYDHPEYRGSAYVRVDVPKNAPPDADAKAHVIASEIAAALGNERGLMPPQLVDLAQGIAGGRAKLSHEVVAPYTRQGLDPTYTDALFAIPEVGRTSNAVRTPWGWDVILFSDLVAEAHPPAAEVIEKMLPDVKRSFFPQWTNQIAERIGAKIEIEEKNLPLLENL